VHVSVLSLALCAAVAAGWAAAGWFCLRCDRRRARYRAEWARAAAGLRDLDAELDQVWAVELRRIRGYP
jgi:hypothetical protein